MARGSARLGRNVTALGAPDVSTHQRAPLTEARYTNREPTPRPGSTVFAVCHNIQCRSLGGRALITVFVVQFISMLRSGISVCCGRLTLLPGRCGVFPITDVLLVGCFQKYIKEAKKASKALVEAEKGPAKVAKPANKAVLDRFKKKSL